MYLALSLLAILIVLLLSEYGWRKRWLANEFGRKFVHITVGSFVAFWPFFLSWNEIRFMSVAFLVVVLISNKLKFFHAIHSVQRPTYGEVFFAISVGLLTFVTHSKAIYAAGILQMSLADGFAAIVGTRFGRSNKYHILGQVKSAAGTSAFILTSLAIFVGYGVLHAGTVLPWQAAIAATIAAVIENLAPLGLDNLLVPVFVGVVLQVL